MSTRVFWSIGGRGGARQESRTILGVHHWLRGIPILSTLFFKCYVCWQRSFILTHWSRESSAKEQVRNEAIALVLKSDKWGAILQGAGWSKVRWGLGSLYECSSHLNYPRIRGRKALFPQVHTRVCPDEEAELIRSGLLCSFLKLKRAPGSNEGFCYQPQSPGHGNMVSHEGSLTDKHALVCISLCSFQPIWVLEREAAAANRPKALINVDERIEILKIKVFFLKISGVKVSKLNVLCYLFIFRDLPQVPAHIYHPLCNSSHKWRVNFVKWALTAASQTHALPGEEKNLCILHRKRDVCLPGGSKVSAAWPLVSVCSVCHHLDLFLIVEADVKYALVAGGKPFI